MNNISDKSIKISISAKNRIERNSKVIMDKNICKIPLSNGDYVNVNKFNIN